MKWLVNTYFKDLKAKFDFNVNFWLNVSDKTIYEILLHLKVISDLNPKNKSSLNNEKLTSNIKSNLWFLSYKKWNLQWDYFTMYVDIFYIFFTYLNFFFTNNVLFFNNRGFVRRLQTSNNFYSRNLNKVNFINFINFNNYGWLSFFKAIKYWFLTIFFITIIVYYMLVVRLLPFNKVIFQWFMVLMFFYWLISGFVFFIKKYQYRYFTSSIQRFWRRCFAIFWLLELYLFLCFLYLTLNANQEPVFMYDNIQVYKTHLFSWKLFLLKLMPLTLVIIFTYFLLLSLKWNTFVKTNYLSVVITGLLFYVLWLEFYQFFHIISYYGNLTWVYDIEDHLWNLDSEWRRTRVSNHFVTICLIAKFWHVVFAFVFWLFFIFRGLEISRFRYPLLSANFQNFLIIYVLGWLYMYPWIKYIIKKFLEMPYTWFYINNRRLFIFMFFNDVKIFYYNILYSLYNFVINLFNKYFIVYDFFYWHKSSIFTGYTQYKKNFIRDIFIQNIL